MHALTLDPSAEDCSSSNFQESTRRPALPPPPTSLLPTPSATVPAPSTLSTAAANNPSHHTSHQQLRRQQFPGRKAQRHRGLLTNTISASPERHGDDTADACTVALVTERPLAAAENDNVATVKREQPSDNGQLNSGTVDEKTRRYNRISMIIIYGREVLCILALILTTYATIQNSPPKISKAPPPVPFFSKGSLVNDWPTGALGTTQTRVSVSELSLVLYYAPWCAESQFARHAYERVAQLYYREAHFAAINCWQPGGECRARYTKVQSWPVLMAYQPSGLAVQYHQAWTTAALSRFMQSLMLPLHRFGSPGDLMDHMTGKDAVLVAFLDVAQDSKLYHRYYQASLKWLEKDPFQEVSFGVVTGQSSKLFGVEKVPSFRLYLWNETIEYEGNSPWTPQDLIAWVHKHLHVVSMWIAPPGNVKSTTLAPYLRQGPVLMLLSPRPLYEDSSDAYMMLRQLSMQYYNCPGDAWILEMAREYIAEQRTSNAARYVEKREHCVRVLGRHPSQEEEDDEGSPGSRRYGRSNKCKDGFKSTVSVSFVNVLNSSKFVDGKPVGGKLSAEEYCDIAPAVGCGKHECGAFGPDGSRKPSLMWQTDGCSSRRYNEVNTNYEQARSIVTSMIDSKHDYRGPKLLARQNLRQQCELLQLAEAEKSNVFFSEPARQKESMDYYAAIGGLSCKHNKTLTFISMDSGLYHAFGERLGVDVLKEPNRTVAFIVDHTDESAYVLRDPINLNTLSKFVHDYYNRSLVRFLRSKSTTYQHSHAFNVESFVAQDQLYLERHRILLDAAEAKTKAEEASQKQAKAAKGKRTNASESEQPVSPSGSEETAERVRAPRVYHRVREIYSSNFQRTVLDSNRTVVVSFYSTQCAFCYIQAHHLLTVSRMLRHQPNLWFVRIDGELNDLPWEYTMDVFPSLLIFPNGRKAESRIFPEALKVNVPNIVGFILSNLAPAERLHATFLLCSDVNNASLNDCLHMLKRELTDGIRLSLLEWRRHPANLCVRDRIVRRLQLLKQSYLDTLRCLSHSCDLTQLVNVRKRILDLWTGEHCRSREGSL
ncbi:thioredoxin domain-containing protein 11 [Anopheles funestus]|uniref:thioredoxin domain-containing protein 11 n=1 Tax=Anopheles funestus TaxID=62324 RepID=UPI0020C5B715|nr:thioredoxin domain-containing protein 11 [Anopheles funestus]